VVRFTVAHRVSTGEIGEHVGSAPRDVERIYSTAEVVAKLRRLADALETETPFRIQIANERIRVPARARFSIEHERDEDQEEIEFQLTWSAAEHTDDDTDDDDRVV
jgi:amphi-Trp domain-containing protein